MEGVDCVSVREMRVGFDGEGSLRGKEMSCE